MKKSTLILILCLAAILAFNSGVRPILHRRDAIKTVDSLLSCWKRGDLTLAMAYWEKEDAMPPVYGLSEYDIINGEISKAEGRYSAKITALLDFPPDNLTPSGKFWVFDLKKTRQGWKIVKYRLADIGQL